MTMYKSKWLKICMTFALLSVFLLPMGQSVIAVKSSIVSTSAGQSIWGDADGSATEAQFRLPTAAAIDRQGNIYIADTGNHLIRLLTSDGRVSVYAGQVGEKDAYGQPLGGYADGTALEALFNEPKGLTVAPTGEVYVADAGNGMIRRIDPSGEVSTIAEGLHYPSDIVMDEAGNLIVADTLAHRIIQISTDGVRVMAGGGYVEEDGWLNGAYRDGTGEQAQFNEPSGLALHDSGTLYIADTGNQRIRALSPDGQVTTVAGSGDELIDGTSYIVGGYGDGLAHEAQFNFPQHIAVTDDQTLYVADTLNHRIREVTPAGEVRTVAGSDRHGSLDGVGVWAGLDHPTAVLLKDDDGLLIVDQWNHKLRSLQWVELPVRADGDGDIRIIWNNEVISLDVQPQIVQGRTMVPVRHIGQAFGYDVDWDGSTQQVTLTHDKRTVVLQVGVHELTGDVELLMDVAPYIEGDRVLVPLRFVSEVFGKHVTWFGEHRTVLLQD